MYSILVNNYLVKFNIEKDEDQYIFKERIKYIYKNVKSLEMKNKESINKVVIDSLILKNKLLYKVNY